jgi:proteasome accessory factor B
MIQGRCQRFAVSSGAEALAVRRTATHRSLTDAMADRISKTQRWLDLIALLLARRVPLAVDEIMDRVPAYAQACASGEEIARKSARRMFERDKDELRAIGIPLERVDYQINYGAEFLEGYRIQDRHFYLPYLKVLGGEGGTPAGLPSIEVDAGEASDLLEALRQITQIPGFPMVAEARSAMSRLSFDLDPEQYPAGPIVWVEAPGAGDLLDRLAVLSDALLAGKRVAFRYHGIRRGTTTEREVEPYGLLFQRDWYLVGLDRGRAAVRVFRVGRMEDVRPNTRQPRTRDYQVPDDFDLRAFAGRPAWHLADEAPLEVEVRFRFPSSLLVARNGQGDLVVEEADGAAVRRFSVTDPHPFLRWVLGFAGEATVLSPAGVRDAFREMAEQTLDLYRRRHD